MANPQRAAQLTKLHKVLKAHYKPFPFDHKRPLLEQAIFAALLENSSFEQAEAIYASLLQKYFDWNEVRVSTITELGEALGSLFDSPARATQLKKVLQGIFEAKYTFDLEILKKQNLGAAVKELHTMTGASSFVVNFVAQNALGGHAIGLDRGAWEILVIAGIATPVEAATGELTGLERTIPKTKGVEFFTLLHQASAEYLRNPAAPGIRKLITSVNSAAVFPKKGESALKLPEPKQTQSKPTPMKAKPGDKAAEKAATDKPPVAKAAADKAATDKSKIGDKSKTDGKVDAKTAAKGKEVSAAKSAAKPVPAKAVVGKISPKSPEKAAPEKSRAKTVDKKQTAQPDTKTAPKHTARVSNNGTESMKLIKPGKPGTGANEKDSPKQSQLPKSPTAKKALPVVAAKKPPGKQLAKRKPR